MNPMILKVAVPLVSGGVIVGAGAVGYHMLTSEEGYRVIQAYQLEGSAVVDRPSIGQLDVYEKMLFASGDYSWTSGDSYLYLSLDNSEYILMEPNTVISLEATGSGDNTKTHIYLEQGAIINRLDDPLNPGETYEVTTPNSTMAVRGTEFRTEVLFDEEGVSHTDLQVYEGVVETVLEYPDGTRSKETMTFSAGQNARMWGTEETSDYEYMDVDDAQSVDYSNLSWEGLTFLQAGSSEGGHTLTITEEQLANLIEISDGPATVVVDASEIEVGDYNPDQPIDGYVVDPNNPNAVAAVIDGYEGETVEVIGEAGTGSSSATGKQGTTDGTTAGAGTGSKTNSSTDTASPSGSGTNSGSTTSTTQNQTTTEEGSADTGSSDTGDSDTGNTDTGNTDTGNTDTGNTDTGETTPADDGNNDNPENTNPSDEPEETDSEEVLIENEDENVCIVSFYYNGKLFCQQSVTKGGKATKPALNPSENGKWKFNFNNSITADISIYWSEE